MTTLSHLICQGLIDAGIDRLYCLPGVQNDDFYNILFDHPALQPVVARHEQACSYMATGAALATGKPQAYSTVPGQGVLNAAAGHSTALATSARVFALLGQNKREFIGKMHGQLHELPNQMAVVDQLSKHATAMRDDAAAPAQIAEALGVIQDRFQSIDIGSYPFFRKDRYGTSLVLRGTSADTLLNAMAEVKDAIVAAGAVPEDETGVS